MKRYHQEQHIIDRRAKVARQFQVPRSRGYFRKKHPLDCGNPRCGVCHSDKRFGHEQTRQELAAELRQQDQVGQ